MIDREGLAELAEIARGLLAHLDWQKELGASGLPRDLTAKRRVDEFWASHAMPDPTPPAAPRAAAPVAAAPLAAAPRPEPLAPARPSAIVQPSGALPVVQAQSGAPASTAATLSELEAEVRACERCALAAGRTQTVFARGSPQSRICFVGEGPGAEEDAQGAPFVGPAGQLLDKMIAAMGLGRDEVYVCNIVKCRPPGNRRPEPPEMAACSGFLRRQIALADPEVIVALGGTAVSGLLGLTDGITRLRGTFRLYDGMIPVMPTFHPAYLLRNPSAKREVWSDLRAVLAHVGRTLPGTK